MKGVFSRGIDAIRDQLRSWGVDMPAARSGPAEARLLVFEPATSGAVHVGTLTEEDGQFVFRYAPSYVVRPEATPIPDFPELHGTYRSRELFPFFAVRLPPSGRSDVQQALRARGLAPEQTLQVLDALGHRSVANPYQLKLAEAA